MENPGAITYRDNALLIDPKAASALQRQTLARFHAHEFAHMWFGDWVTMQWWDDVWLNESFADWMGDKITNQLYPELGLKLGELQTIQAIMTGDARPSTHAIQREVVNASEGLDDVQVAYYKGKSVLSMFEAWMGPEVFRKGVNDYLKAHAWKNAVAADFWDALSKASGRDVAGALQGFIAQPGLPLVSAEPQADGSVTLTQKRFLNYGVQAPASTWQIPVGLKYSDGTKTKTMRVLLKEPTQNVKLEGVTGKVAWVMPNADAVGYYRWSVPSEMMQTLAKNAVASLDAAERVSLLGNLEALLNAGQITGDAYARALPQFADDPEPAVTSALIGGLTKVRQSFVPDDLRGAFAPYVRQVLGPAAQRIGYDRRPGESERAALVRPQLMNALGYLGRDEATLKAADRIAKSYLADPSSVDPGAAGSSLQLVALKGDRAMFDDFKQRFETSKVPADRARFLTALGRFEDPALEKAALDYSLQPAVRPTDMFQLVGSVASKTEASADRVFAFQRENYDKVMAKLPPVFARYMVNAANGCSLEKLETGRSFFFDPKRKVPGSEHEFAQVEDAVKDCAGLRQREGAKVAAYLTAPVGAR
jgi:alanyl aminopeptidase